MGPESVCFQDICINMETRPREGERLCQVTQQIMAGPSLSTLAWYRPAQALLQYCVLWTCSLTHLLSPSHCRHTSLDTPHYLEHWGAVPILLRVA